MILRSIEQEIEDDQIMLYFKLQLLLMWLLVKALVWTTKFKIIQLSSIWGY